MITNKKLSQEWEQNWSWNQVCETFDKKIDLQYLENFFHTYQTEIYQV
jgi:hypothetical protein